MPVGDCVRKPRTHMVRILDAAVPFGAFLPDRSAVPVLEWSRRERSLLTIVACLSPQATSGLKPGVVDKAYQLPYLSHELAPKLASACLSLSFPKQATTLNGSAICVLRPDHAELVLARSTLMPVSPAQAAFAAATGGAASTMCYGRNGSSGRLWDGSPTRRDSLSP